MSVMAAWPDHVLERVDTMVRTVVAAALQAHDCRWNVERLVAFLAKAGCHGGPPRGAR